MKRQELRVGMRVKLLDQEYSNEQRLLGRKLVLKHVASGTLSTKSEHQMVKAMSRGDAEVLSEYEEDEDRYGRRLADLRHGINEPGVSATRPFERVQIDDTKSDLFVTQEKTNPIGRPWLVINICTFTKIILGLRLSSSKPIHGSPNQI